MKGILKFNLPEEQIEFNTAVNASKYSLIVSDVDDYLRGKLKYGHDFKSIDEALEKTREFLTDLRSQYGVLNDF